MNKILPWVTTHPLATVLIGLGLALLLILAARTEPSARIAGGALQLGGIVTVVLGINDTRKLFGLPSYLDLAKHQARRFFHRPEPPLELSVEGGVHINAKVRARLTVSHKFDPEASTGDRLTAVEAEFTHVYEQIEDLLKEISLSRQEAEKTLKKERDERISKDKAISETLVRTETGGLNLSFVGAVWLLVGVTFTTLSIEIARLFNPSP